MAKSLKIIRSTREPLEEHAVLDPIPIDSSAPDLDAAGIVTIDPKQRFQEIMGFGGAFTEAGADALNRLSPDLRTQALEAYFHPDKGLNYTFCRTHINSCDFSLGNYAYVEEPGDVELKTFSIDRDRQLLLPLIQDALKIRGDGAPVRIFASPWSPPAWMKTTGQMNHGGSLKPEYYQVWADYFVRYLQEYAQEGVEMWGVSIQNEPQAKTRWDNCLYSDEEERDFAKILGPTLEKAGLGHVRLIVWDHNKDIMRSRVDTILGDPEAAKWVWGVGFHWYGSTDNADIEDDSVLDYTHETYGKSLVFTEGCNPLWRSQGESKTLIGEWWTGEKYARHIINDLKHWTTAWCDWNLFLDERGGPNHVNNFCDAPIIADTQNNRLYFNSPYYYLGHFSKFIREGAVRIGSTSADPELEVLATQNADGSLAIVVLNETDIEKTFTLDLPEGNATLTAPAHSIQTILS